MCVKVYVGKKCSRGVLGSRDPVIEGFLNINATSGSNNKINGLSAKQFSPMYLGPVNEKELFGIGDAISNTFEGYWQGQKIFKELSHLDINNNLTIKWDNFRKKEFSKIKGDRHPNGTKSNEVKFVDESGRRHFKYYTAISSSYLGMRMDYITSRKYIYVPIYAYLVFKTQVFQELRRQVDNGLRVQILDFDILSGSHEVTLEFLKERINDPKLPFGHGYVIAGLLAGIDFTEYCYN